MTQNLNKPQGNAVEYSGDQARLQYGEQLCCLDLSDEDPLPLGPADPGDGEDASRWNHVHPHGNLAASENYPHDSDQVENVSDVDDADTVTDALNALQAAIPIINPYYCDMFENTPGAPTNIALVLAGTWYPWISAALGRVSAAGLIGFFADPVNGDYIRVDGAAQGDYRVSLTGSFSGSANALIRVAVFQGLVATPVGAIRALNAAGDVGSFAAHRILPVAAGDEFRVMVSALLAGETFGVQNMTMSLERVEL